MLEMGCSVRVVVFHYAVLVIERLAIGIGVKSSRAGIVIEARSDRCLHCLHSPVDDLRNEIVTKILVYVEIIQRGKKLLTGLSQR